MLVSGGGRTGETTTSRGAGASRSPTARLQLPQRSAPSHGSSSAAAAGSHCRLTQPRRDRRQASRPRRPGQDCVEAQHRRSSSSSSPAASALPSPFAPFIPLSPASLSSANARHRQIGGRPSPGLDGGAPVSLRMGERRLLLLGPCHRCVCVHCWRS